jgi:hypothetical protein
LKFYILREKETLYGHFQLPAAGGPLASR